MSEELGVDRYELRLLDRKLNNLSRPDALLVNRSKSGRNAFEKRVRPETSAEQLISDLVGTVEQTSSELELGHLFNEDRPTNDTSHNATPFSPKANGNLRNINVNAVTDLTRPNPVSARSTYLIGTFGSQRLPLFGLL